MALKAEPFHFLDLPKELRLMVYERIPITTRHYTHPAADIWHVKSSDYPTSRSATVTLVTRSIPASLLATCRLIHCEATPLKLKLGSLAKEPLRFVLDADAWDGLSSYPSVLVIAWTNPRRARSNESCTMLQSLIVESLACCLPEGSVNVDSAQSTNPHLFVSKCALGNSRAHTTSRKIARRAEVEICVPETFHLATYLMEFCLTRYNPTRVNGQPSQYNTRLTCKITAPVPATKHEGKGVRSITSEWLAQDINVVRRTSLRNPAMRSGE